MLRIRIRYSPREWLMLILFYLLVFQRVLEEISTVFNYVDECVALLGLTFFVYKTVSKGKLVSAKADMRIVLALAVFVATGLLSNVIYQYQSWGAVLEDVYVCLKFFFCIILGRELFRRYEFKEHNCVILAHAKFVTVVLFALLLIDLAFQVFPSPGTRYGLRVVQLGYGHATYLAGATVFLLGIFTMFYEKKNNAFILMSILLLIFTLRGKAIAGAAVYVALFFFVLYRRKKIKLIHIVFLGLLALVVAWEQVIYHYVALADESARAVLSRVSFQILNDYFPIGTGFGTFASHVAIESYSPVYFMYGLNTVYGLSESFSSFGSDTFWPIIVGQTGAIGTMAYIFAIGTLFINLLKVRTNSNPAYAAGVFLFVYLIIASTSESAFCNSVAVPIAWLMGGILVLNTRQ